MLIGQILIGFFTRHLQKCTFHRRWFLVGDVTHRKVHPALWPAPRLALFAARARQARRRGSARALSRAFDARRSETVTSHLSVSPEEPYKQAPRRDCFWRAGAAKCRAAPARRHSNHKAEYTRTGVWICCRPKCEKNKVGKIILLSSIFGSDTYKTPHRLDVNAVRKCLEVGMSVLICTGHAVCVPAVTLALSNFRGEHLRLRSKLVQVNECKLVGLFYYTVLESICFQYDERSS